MSKRKSRKQATRRPNGSLLERLGGFVLSCVSWFGTSKGLYISMVAIVVVTLGIAKSLPAPSSAKSVEEHVPDEITQPCWAMIVRRGMRETTVDRAAREEMEAALKDADKCTDKSLQ